MIVDRPTKIPPSASDLSLRSRGFDLVAEYDALLDRAGFDRRHPVLECATGSGRMTAILAHRGFSVVSHDRSFALMDRVLMLSGTSLRPIGQSFSTGGEVLGQDLQPWWIGR